MFRRAATLILATATVFAVACDDSGVDPVPAGSTGPETVTSAAGQAAAEGYALPGANAQLAAIHELQSAFHGALNASDAEALRALFAEDATLQVGAANAVGLDEIMAFFEAAPPFVSGWAALAPTYDTQVEIKGNTAEYAFECVYVADSDNLTGSPVLAHLNASGTMRKVGNRWLFQSFQGGVGSLQ